MDISNFISGDYLEEWKDFFLDSEVKKELNIIANNLKSLANYYPKPQYIYRIFEDLSPKDIKVLILSSSNCKDSQGICFSNTKEITKQWKTIAINNKKTISLIKTSNLEYLVEQGVFLLNTTLVCDDKKIKKYTDMWKNFITLLLNYIHNKNKDVIYIVWGKAPLLYIPKNIPKNNIIKVGGNIGTKTFEDSESFFKANELLKKKGEKEIEWN